MSRRLKRAAGERAVTYASLPNWCKSRRRARAKALPTTVPRAQWVNHPLKNTQKAQCKVAIVLTVKGHQRLLLLLLLVLVLLQQRDGVEMLPRFRWCW